MVNEVPQQRTHAIWAFAAALVAGLLAQTAVVWLLLALLAQALARAAGWTRRPWTAAWLVVVVLAVVNSVKWPESDLAEYYLYLDYVRTQSWWALVSDPDSHLSVRQTEPVFRSAMWLLAQISPAPRISFTLLCTVGIYGVALALSAAFLRIGESSNDEEDPAPVVAAIAALLLGITFSLTAHLVRQYLAGGIFMLALLHWVCHRRPIALVWMVISAMVHNSAVLLWLPLAWSELQPRSPRMAWGLLLVAVVASNAGLIGILNDVTEAASLIKDDGQIGIVLPLIDMALLAGGWRLLSQRPSAPLLRGLWLFAAAFAGVLLCIRDVPLMFFRTYFYVEFLRVALMSVLLCTALRRAGQWRAPLAAVVVLIAVGLCTLRVLGAEWSYRSHPERFPEWTRNDLLVERWTMIERLPL